VIARRPTQINQLTRPAIGGFLEGRLRFFSPFHGFDDLAEGRIPAYR
jgi:hypothetical protein